MVRKDLHSNLFSLLDHIESMRSYASFFNAGSLFNTICWSTNYLLHDYCNKTLQKSASEISHCMIQRLTLTSYTVRWYTGLTIQHVLTIGHCKPFSSVAISFNRSKLDSMATQDKESKCGIQILFSDKVSVRFYFLYLYQVDCNSYRFNNLCFFVSAKSAEIFILFLSLY